MGGVPEAVQKWPDAGSARLLSLSHEFAAKFPWPTVQPSDQMGRHDPCHLSRPAKDERLLDIRLVRKAALL